MRKKLKGLVKKKTRSSTLTMTTNTIWTPASTYHNVKRWNLATMTGIWPDTRRELKMANKGNITMKNLMRKCLRWRSTLTSSIQSNHSILPIITSMWARKKNTRIPALYHLSKPMVAMLVALIKNSTFDKTQIKIALLAYICYGEFL